LGWAFCCLFHCFWPIMVPNQRQLSIVVSDWGSYVGSPFSHFLLWDLVFVSCWFSATLLYVLFIFLVFLCCSFNKFKIYAYHAAPFSQYDNSRNRRSHHQRTKQRGQEEWTWEEILDGKGPWAQAGEYRHLKEEMEAAKAERLRYEELAQRSKHERQPPSPGLRYISSAQVTLRQLFARYPQFTSTTQCGLFQLPALAGLWGVSSQDELCQLCAPDLRCAPTVLCVLCWLYALCLQCAVIASAYGASSPHSPS
jgi:hypothetical protein